MSKIVIIEKSDGIGVITLNRPEKANALNQELKAAIVKALDELDADPGVGAIVMKGAGKHFCSGQDYNDVVLGTDPEHLNKYRKIFGTECTAMFDKIVNIGTPVIAAARGVVTGEGFPLCASCDIIYAEQGTSFQFPGTNLGGVSTGPGVVVARYFGVKRTLEHLFSGEPILAEEALQYGLINKIVPKGKLEEAVMRLARKIAAATLANPACKDLGKSTFYTAMDMERSKAVKYAHQQMCQFFVTKPVIDLGKKLLQGKVSLAERQLEGILEK